MHNPWTIARHNHILSALVHFLGLSRPTIEDRIERQIAPLRNMTKGTTYELSARLAQLEAKSDSMDAYYIKVVGSALKQHMDTHIAIQDSKIANIEAKAFKGLQDFQDRLATESRKSEDRARVTKSEIDSARSAISALDARISQIIRQLRNLGESNGHS